MAMVLLYPKKGGTGGANKAEPQYWPDKLVPKMLKNGWSNVPDVEDPKVASSLIEKAQTETAKKLAEVAQREARIEAILAENEALKEQLANKPGRKPKEV